MRTVGPACGARCPTPGARYSAHVARRTPHDSASNQIRIPRAMISHMGGNSRPAALIGADHAAFMQGGVSVIVASRNPERVPDVVRGCGCKVSRDRRHVTVLVEPGRASELLEDIRLTGTIAVVFSQPSTHRTIQLKGTDAHVVPVTPTDRRIAGRHLGDWVEELVSAGYDGEFAAAVRGRAELGLAAIAFTPTAAFDQTPGPAAGTPLKASA